MSIWQTNFKIKKGKEVRIVRDVIVTGQDKKALTTDPYYLKRALKLIDVSVSDYIKYSVEDIEFVKEIKGINP